MSRPTWDETFIAMSKELAKRSKDQNTKIGCCIVNPNNNIILVSGYNCFPRGIYDSIQERQERPVKYFYFEHAERNAIYNAAREGIRLEGSTIYLPYLPCSDCARAIIQAGILEMVLEEPCPSFNWQKSGLRDSYYHSILMLREAGIYIRKINEELCIANHIQDHMMSILQRNPKEKEKCITNQEEPNGD